MNLGFDYTVKGEHHALFKTCLLYTSMASYYGLARHPAVSKMEKLMEELVQTAGNAYAK